jgi:hypothetical protein
MAIQVPQNVLSSQAVAGDAGPATIYPPQRFKQEMEHLWESVNRLPDGQQCVVLHQLMQLGNAFPYPSPHEFPALAIHGFLVEKQVGEHTVWQASTPHLKEFGRLGISASFRNGYALYPRHTFDINLQAQMKQRPQMNP